MPNQFNMERLNYTKIYHLYYLNEVKKIHFDKKFQIFLLRQECHLNK